MNKRRKIIAGFYASLPNWSSYDSTNDKAPVTFTESVALHIKVVTIDLSRVLIVYSGAGQKCYGRIASIDSSGDVTFGTETLLLDQAIDEVDAKLIDSTNALISCDVTGIECFVITFSGTTISSIGTAVTFVAGIPLDPNRIAMLSPTAFLVGWENEIDRDLIVRYGSISGKTITAGNNLTLTTTNTSRLIINTIRPGKAVAFYNQEVDSRLDAQLLSVTGTTPQSDDTITDIANDSDDTSIQSAALIEDGKLLLIYENETIADNIEGVVISESSDALSKGNIYVLSEGSNPEYVSVAMPNNKRAMLSYGINGVGIDSRVISVSGTTLSSGTAYRNISGDKEDVVSSAVGDDFISLCYADDNDSGKGKLLIMRP